MYSPAGWIQTTGHLHSKVCLKINFFASRLIFFILLLPAKKIQVAPSSQILRTKSRNKTKKVHPMIPHERYFAQMYDLSWSRKAGQTCANSPNCNPSLIPGCIWDLLRFTHLYKSHTQTAEEICQIGWASPNSTFLHLPTHQERIWFIFLHTWSLNVVKHH